MFCLKNVRKKIENIEKILQSGLLPRRFHTPGICLGIVVHKNRNIKEEKKTSNAKLKNHKHNRNLQ